jgi:hypothetical protein
MIKAIEFIRLTEEHEDRTPYTWEICYLAGTVPLYDALDICRCPETDKSKTFREV